MTVPSLEDAYAALDASSQFYASLAARHWYGDHVCFAPHPNSEFGSPDHLVEEGVTRAAKLTGQWADQVVGALDGLATQVAIRRAIDAQASRIDIEPFAERLHERMVFGLVLGGLNSSKEHEDLAQFSAVHLRTGPLTKEPLAAALQLWEQRQILPRQEFDALSAELKKRAFTFAGTARDDLLAAAHAELTRQIRNGDINLRDFQRFCAERLESAGWTPANPTHVETIFRTNINSALASGRYAEMTQPDVLAALPYWQIRGVPDARARKTHKDAHNIVLPANHEFWRLAYPPFGFNCRCTVIARTRAWLKRTGTAIGPVPRGLPDPGFTSGLKGIVTVPDSLKVAKPEAPKPAHAPPAPSPRVEIPVVAPPKLPELPKVLPAPLPELPRPAPPVVPTRHPLPTPPSIPPPPAPGALPAIPELPFASLSESEQLKRLAESVSSFEGSADVLTRAFGHIPSPEQLAALSGSAEIPGARVDVRAMRRVVITTLKAPGVEVLRSFTPEDEGLVVGHDYFVMSEERQGQGLGKRVLRRQFAEYLRLGAREVSLDAAWVGRYTWPRMGFTLRNPEDLELIRGHFLAFLKKKRVKGAAGIAAQMQSVHDITTLEVNGRKLGKMFLLSQQPFHLNLKVRLDPEDVAFQRVLAYLGMPLPPKLGLAARPRRTYLWGMRNEPKKPRPGLRDGWVDVAEDLMEDVENDGAVLRFDEDGKLLEDTTGTPRAKHTR